MAVLELRNLHVALEDGTEIVKGVDLKVAQGEIHAVMGPNGSGKSTLSYAIMGHPAYEITEGALLLDGEDITELGADERAQRGLFLAFQYPQAIAGVTVTSFLRSAINATRKARNGGVDDPVPIPEFRKELLEQMDKLKVSRELASRYLNDGFSGGEKKRVEILQMAMLKPRIAVLDETDSGLDIDALKTVAGGVKDLVGPDLGALVITHYQRILEYIKPDFVHVFVDGKIVEEGGPELALRLEAEGLRGVHAGARRRGELDVDPRDRRRQGDPRRVRVRVPRPGGLLLQVRPRPERGDRRRDLRAQERAGVDAQVAPQVVRVLQGAPDAAVGRRSLAGSTSTTSTTTSARPRSRPTRGRTCRRTSRTPGTSSGSPRRRRSTSRASAPSTSPRSSTTSSRRASRSRACSSSTWTRACASTRTSSSSTSAP